MPEQDSVSGNGGRSSVEDSRIASADRREFQVHRLPGGKKHVSIGGEPDVLLDALLKIEECDLEIEGLTAHVSVQAEVADLVKLAIGADVNLEKLKLTLEGVDVQALLKVSLDQIRAILEKALITVGDHPEILLGTLNTAGTAPGEAGRAVRGAVGGGAAADQVPGRMPDQAAAPLKETVNEAAQAVSPDGDSSVAVIDRTIGAPRRPVRKHWHSA